MRGRLLDIAQQEGGEYFHDIVSSKENIDAILQVANGDMRRAVTTLQSVHSLTRGLHANNKVLSRDDICEMAGIPPPSAVQQLLESFQNGSFDVMRAAVDHVLAEGYSAQLLLSALLPFVVQSDQLTEWHKANLCQKLAQAEFGMAQGADESLQLLTVGSAAVQCYAQSRQEKVRTEQ